MEYRKRSLSQNYGWWKHNLDNEERPYWEYILKLCIECSSGTDEGKVEAQMAFENELMCCPFSYLWPDIERVAPGTGERFFGKDRSIRVNVSGLQLRQWKREANGLGLSLSSYVLMMTEAGRTQRRQEAARTAASKELVFA